MSSELHTIESFGRYDSKVDELLAYPGARPDGSFLLSASGVQELSGDYAAFADSTNDVLECIGQPTLEERIPIIAYGANANPPRAMQKMRKYGLEAEQLVVPFVAVAIPDVAAVWHGRPGQTGSIFAELYKGEETAGGQLQTHLSYVTVEQAAVIHASEGATYSLVEVDALVGAEAVPQKVLAYAALNATVLLQAGKPLGVEGLSNSTPLSTMTAREAVDYILAQDGVAAVAGAIAAGEFVGQGIKLSLVDKKARQIAVGNRLTELGLNREYRYPAAAEQLVGRLALDAQRQYGANTATNGATVLHIAEQLLASVRRTKDVMPALRKRATDEIEIRLRSVQ